MIEEDEILNECCKNKQIKISTGEREKNTKKRGKLEISVQKKKKGGEFEIGM